jgi:CBS domain-containing protein
MNMEIMEAKSVADAFKELVRDGPKVKMGAKVHEAVQALIDNPCSRAVYVVDENDKLVGTISYRSLMRASSARFGVRKDGIFSFVQYLKDMLMENVDTLMRKPTPVTKDTKLKKALELMEDTRQNDLPVVDENGRLVGELSGMEIMRLGLDVIKRGDGLTRAEIEKREKTRQDF